MGVMSKINIVCFGNYIKQIMNVAMGQIFSFVERWNGPFNLAPPRLKEHAIFQLMKIFEASHSKTFIICILFYYDLRLDGRFKVRATLN